MISSGIGTSFVRLALVLYWAAGVGVLVVFFTDEIGPAEFLGVIALLAPAFLLTDPHDDPLTLKAGLILSVVTVAAVGLIAFDVVATGEGGRVLGWSVEYASYIGALTAVRVRRALGAATVIASLVWLSLAWVATAPGPGMNGATIATCGGILIVGLVWGTLLPRGRRALLALRDDREKEFAIEETARAGAIAQDARIARVIERVAPELSAVAAGNDLSALELARVRALEGEIRDTLTSPEVDDAAVRRSLFQARTRGVEVSMIDVRDGEDRHPLSPPAVKTITEVLDAVEAGRVALRLETSTSDRARSGTIVVVREGSSERHELPV